MKKGFSLIELLVSLVIISAVMVFLTSFVLNLRDEKGEINIDVQANINQASISRALNYDAIEHGGICNVEITNNGKNCEITYVDEETRQIILNEGTLTYKDGSNIELIKNLNGNKIFGTIEVPSNYPKIYGNKMLYKFVISAGGVGKDIEVFSYNAYTGCNLNPCQEGETHNSETGKCEYTASLDHYDCPNGGTPNASNVCQLSPTTKYMCYQNAPIIYNCICYKDGYGDMYFSGGNVDWRTATLCQGMCISNSWSYVSFNTTYDSCPAGTQPSGSMCLDYTPRDNCSGWNGYWNTSSECSVGSPNGSYCEYSGTPVYTCPTTGPHNDVQLNNTTCSYTP